MKTRPASILVIDDDEKIREVLSELLTFEGYKVTSAASGEEGLKEFQKGKFDLVLTNLEMPGISGWEVARRIKQMSPKTPVGLMTGRAAEISKEEIKKRGIDLLLPKPFKYDQLLKAVSELLKEK